MAHPERSPERDAAIEAMLPYVPQTGWTMTSLLAAAGPDADLLFPGGTLDMIETYCDWADRRMEAEAVRDAILAASGRLDWARSMPSASASVARWMVAASAPPRRRCAFWAAGFTSPPW